MEFCLIWEVSGFCFWGLGFAVRTVGLGAAGGFVL